MQPRGRRVVRHLDLRAQGGQVVEGAQLGAVGVRRRDQPKSLPVPAVPAERLEHWADTAPANERHDRVDCVSGVDLGPQLVTDRRFAAGVRQQRGVDQGCERGLERFGGAVGQAPQDRGEHARGIERDVGVGVDRRAQVRDDVDEVADELRARLRRARPPEATRSRASRPSQCDGRVGRRLRRWRVLAPPGSPRNSRGRRDGARARRSAALRRAPARGRAPPPPESLAQTVAARREPIRNDMTELSDLQRQMDRPTGPRPRPRHSGHGRLARRGSRRAGEGRAEGQLATSSCTSSATCSRGSPRWRTSSTCRSTMRFVATSRAARDADARPAAATPDQSLCASARTQRVHRAAALVAQQGRDDGQRPAGVDEVVDQQHRARAERAR